MSKLRLASMLLNNDAMHVGKPQSAGMSED